ncbi:MAG: IncP-type conjugal transfer protein TraG [bacterium]|nr:IncP-type conjugal transfer protein TraG [bacterium]
MIRVPAATGSTVSAHAPIYDLGQDRPGARIGLYVTPVIAVVGVMVLIIWGVTEWVAWRFHFHPNLGAPAISPNATVRTVGLLLAFGFGSLSVASVWIDPLRRVIGTLVTFGAVAFTAAWIPVYAPWDVFRWGIRFGDTPGAEPIFSVAWHSIAIPGHLLFLVAMYVAWRRAKQNARGTDAHGSARWASPKEVATAGLLEGEGVFLGLFKKSAGDCGAYLRHGGSQHVLGFAPTRSGKGVGWVIPTLLTWPGSVLVHDIKGENWAQTAGWRAGALANRCLKFDPTCMDGSGARYNPLLEVRRGPLEVRDAQNIADMLVDSDGKGMKDHWDLTAEEVLVAAILHVLYAEPNKTLRGCLELLTDPKTDIQNVLSRMKRTEHDPTLVQGWLDSFSGEPTATHPVVSGAAQSLLNKSDNERSSVISSAVKCLSLWRDDIVAANTEACDFAIEDLVEHSEPVSLYLVVPPSDVSRMRPLIRLIVNTIGRRLTEKLNPSEGEAAPARRRLLLMMDEFPTLGRLDFFQTQLAYLAGYGIQAFLIVQDLSQLYAAYGRDESIVSNCHVRVAYAPNKVETAQLLSTMAGVMTVRKARRMYSGNRLSPWLSHVMEAEEESQRPLITPDEVMRLPEDNAIVFIAGERPIWAMKARYFADARLAKRAGLMPPDRCEPIPHGWQEWTHSAEESDHIDASTGRAGDAARADSAADTVSGGDLLDELLPDDETPAVQATADLA